MTTAFCSVWVRLLLISVLGSRVCFLNLPPLPDLGRLLLLLGLDRNDPLPWEGLDSLKGLLLWAGDRFLEGELLLRFGFLIE